MTAPTAPSDPFDLARFVDAQARMYALALQEVEAGAKESHWMWFVFPQLKGLGFSPTAAFYGLSGPEEARAFLAHPILGPRLRRITEAALLHEGLDATAIFGTPDDLKLRSSMTLFERAGEGPWARAIERLCGGERCGRTLERLRRRP